MAENKSNSTEVGALWKRVAKNTGKTYLAGHITTEDLGASAIMPLASPIGSGLGIQNKINISLIIKQSKVPVIVDAGIGTASDATISMELGCDGVLINSAIAMAQKPILMARAFKDAVISGRNAYLSGRMRKASSASPSSPKKGLI